MKEVLKSSIVGAAIISSVSAFAEVPSLESAIEALPQDQFTEFEAQFDAAESVITADVDFAIDTAVVAEAVEQGFISETEAADLETAVSLIEANQEFLDFDVINFIATQVESGNISAATAAGTLEIFNNLSDADKAIVGQSSFSPWASSPACGNTCDPSSDLLGSGNSANQSAAFQPSSSAGHTAVASAPLPDPDNIN